MLDNILKYAELNIRIILKWKRITSSLIYICIRKGMVCVIEEQRSKTHLQYWDIPWLVMSTIIRKIMIVTAFYSMNEREIQMISEQRKIRPMMIWIFRCWYLHIRDFWDSPSYSSSVNNLLEKTMYIYVRENTLWIIILGGQNDRRTYMYPFFFHTLLHLLLIRKWRQQ